MLSLINSPMKSDLIINVSIDHIISILESEFNRIKNLPKKCMSDIWDKFKILTVNLLCIHDWDSPRRGYIPSPT